MEHQITLVVEELSHHCATAIKEAHRGNKQAKQWLLESFPGNEDQFNRLWSGEKIIGFDRTCRPKRRERIEL